MSLSKTLSSIITYSFYSLLFLVPLVLTPLNFELFEFNKMMLTYILTIIITASWLAKMVLEKRVKIPRTPLDIPLWLFFISQLVATIFSLHSYTSVWGYYSRFHGGLASTVAYLLLFYAFVANFDKPKTLKAIYFTLTGAFLVAFYGILEHFGIDKDYWVQDVQNRVFSTLGQPNWLAAWLIALIPLTWAFILTTKSEKKGKKITVYGLPRTNLMVWGLLFTVYYLCLLYTKSRSGLIGFFVSLLLFTVLFLFKKPFRKPRTKILVRDKKDRQLLVRKTVLILGLTLFISLLIGTEFTPSLGQIFQKFSKKTDSLTAPAEAPTPLLISKSSDIRKVVWKGALLVWLDNPKTILIGDGPETFGYAYYNHRPKEHNLLSEWDFLYNKAHNEYLNFLANSGIFGLGSYLSIIGVFIIWSLKRIMKYELGIRNYGLSRTTTLVRDLRFTDYELRITDYGLLAGYSSILVTNFFGFSVVAVALLFFLLPAFSFVLSGLPKKFWQFSLKKTISYQLSAISYLLLVLIIILNSYFIIHICQLWFADRYFSEGKNWSDNNYALKAIKPLEKAVKLNKNQADFHAELAEAAAQIATSLAISEASPSAEVLAWQQKAIEETQRAIELNPVHLNILKSQGRTYVRLAQLDSSFLNKAYEVLNQAIKLAPTEPRVRYNQALVLNQMEREEEAIELLEQTVALKPDYGQARFALALLYKENDQLEEAKEQLQFILEKINPEDETAQKELELLNL